MLNLYYVYIVYNVLMILCEERICFWEEKTQRREYAETVSRKRMPIRFDALTLVCGEMRSVDGKWLEKTGQSLGNRSGIVSGWYGVWGRDGTETIQKCIVVVLRYR